MSFELAERGGNEGLEEADDMIIERGSKGIYICVVFFIFRVPGMAIANQMGCVVFFIFRVEREVQGEEEEGREKARKKLVRRRRGPISKMG